MLGLFLTFFSVVSTQELAAQVTESKWNGPRWSSMQVTNTVNLWIEENVPPLVNDGDWWRTNYTYIGRGTWIVVISWGANFGQETEQTLGSETLQVKSNGDYIVIQEPLLR